MVYLRDFWLVFVGFLVSGLAWSFSVLGLVLSRIWGPGACVVFWFLVGFFGLFLGLLRDLFWFFVFEPMLSILLEVFSRGL